MCFYIYFSVRLFVVLLLLLLFHLYFHSVFLSPYSLSISSFVIMSAEQGPLRHDTSRCLSTVSKRLPLGSSCGHTISHNVHTLLYSQGIIPSVYKRMLSFFSLQRNKTTVGNLPHVTRNS